MASWLEFCEAESLRVSRLLGGSPPSNYSTNVWSLTKFLRNSLITLPPFAGTRTAPNDVRLMVYVVLNLVLFGFQPNTFLGFSSCKNICIVLNLYETEAGNDKLEVLPLSIITIKSCRGAIVLFPDTTLTRVPRLCQWS